MQADQELIDLLQKQVASLTTALEEVSARCETLERDVAMRRTASPSIPPVPPLTDSQAASAAVPVGTLASLLSRVAALESSSSASTVTPAAASSAAAASVSAAAAAASASKPGSQPKSKNKTKGPLAPVASVPASVPAPSSPAVSGAAPVAPVSGDAAPAASAPSWVDVVRKKKPSLLTPELIKNSPDPLRMMLSSGHQGLRITTEIMMTQAVIPLSIKAQGRPYLAWRSILKIKVGFTPVHMVLIHPRRALLFWDVSDVRFKGRILRALDGSGFFRFPAERG